MALDTDCDGFLTPANLRIGFNKILGEESLEDA